MGYEFQTFKPDFSIILSAIAQSADAMMRIATHLTVIVKSLERPNFLHTYDVSFVQCINPN